MLFGCAGLLAAKWVTDLVDGDLGPETLRCTQSGTSHNLLTVSSQSAPQNGLVVCICAKCKKTLTVQFHSSSHLCREIKRPHHLVLIDEEATLEKDRDKYYPLLSKFTFKCSSMNCSMQVVLDVCTPRLDPKCEPDLIDRKIPRTRLDELLETDGNPARYEELLKPDKAQKLFPAFYMLQYLNDVVNPAGRALPLKVSIRNKFFTVCFSDRFPALFDYMEFESVTEGDETYVQLPALDDQADSPTPYATRRAWFEILRIHFHFLQVGLPDNLKQPIDLHLQSGTKDVFIQLLDAQYPRTRYANIDDYDPKDFILLGVNKDVHESLLWYACYCQGQTNPAQRRAAYEALSRVSRARESSNSELRQYLEDEAIELTTLMSINDARPSPLSRAYQSLEVLESANDSEIGRAFTERMTKIKTPQDRKAERLNLSTIGKARKSHGIMMLACAFANPEEAAEFLNVTTTTEPDWIISQLVVEESEGNFDKILVAYAVRSLATILEGDAQMRLLQHAFDLENAADMPWLATTNSITVASGAGMSTSNTSASQAVDPSLPLGLVNIRNTCYLNSILQYFNTVVPVREVVLNWEKYKLEPTEENIKSRRLGGSGSALDKAEAFLAAKFVEEIKNLYLELQSSNQVAIRPQQRLALAALKTADQIMKGNPTETITAVYGPQPNPNASKDLPPPPPLPARPSPKPPTQTPHQSSEPLVTVNQVMDSGDTGSNVSSATLVDQKDEEQDQTYVSVAAPEEEKCIPQVVPAKARSALDDDDHKDKMTETDYTIRGRSATREQDTREEGDVTMGGTEENAGVSTVEATVEDSLTIEERITEALNDTSATGTDQQDVEEVMGNILEHLHAAIKPTGVDEKTGRQTDIITETFYWSSVNQIRTIDMETGKAKTPYRTIPDLSRWMTAFPDEKGGIDLYAALDKTFDQEFQEDGSETFTSITKTPPILHVYIQRSQNVAGRLTRNGNVVEIPETLYLDRYMDGSIESEIFRKRQRCWNLKRRLKALEGRMSIETTPPKVDKGKQKEEIKEAGYEVVESIEEYEKEMMSVDHTGEGEGDEEYVSILDPETQQMLTEHELMPTAVKGADAAMVSRESLLASLDPDAAKRAQEKADEDRIKVTRELAGIFTDMHDVAYRLHAVICHGGGYGSGHYWVWIYDFEKDLWRKYNDETVEVHTDNTKVLTDLNASGHPYYVAYVRADDVSRLVSVPQRLSVEANSADKPPSDGVSRPETSPSIEHETVLGPSKFGGSGAADEVINGVDVDMDDAHVMHVENRDE